MSKNEYVKILIPKRLREELKKEASKRDTYTKGKTAMWEIIVLWRTLSVNKK